MTEAIIVVSLLLTATGAAAQSAAQVAPEVVGEVRVHGNHTTPDADVLALAALPVGTPLGPKTLADAEARLRAAGRFSDVELRKRFRSIADPSDVLIVILVDEVIGISDTDLTPSPMKRFRSLGMWLPIVDYADGYGFTYGARVSFVDVAGPRSRLSAPLTWGGERRAAVQLERSFDRGPISRVEGTFGIARRENPYFEIGDTRQSASVRVERTLASWLRAGGGVAITNVSFADLDETHNSSGADLIVDTRRDPAFPRNAVYARVGYEHLNFRTFADLNRSSTDLSGFVGLLGSSVLALRFTTSQVDGPAPPYEQQLLGGTSSLRGYRFGHRVGDNLAAASAEVRVPLTSPLNIGRLGVKGFVDYGTVYPYGAKLADQEWEPGMGGGVFIHATILRMGLDVAWPKEGAKPRWHFGLGVIF